MSTATMSPQDMQQQTTKRQQNLTKRQLTEAEFHDKWAEEINFQELDPEVTFEASTAQECQYILSEMAKAGSLAGKNVLDLGCGCGESAVYFAKQGAVVSACDISPKFVEVAKQLAEHHNVGINATVSTAERLPYPDQSFDFVYANGVLHHVDIIPTMLEIKRILKPGGRGFFIEPLPYNPAINVYRQVAKEVRTPDERPLNGQDCNKIRAVFPETEIKGFWFFTLLVFMYFFLIERANPNKERYWKKVLYEAENYQHIYKPLKMLDNFLLPKLRFLEPLCWNMVISVTA